MMSRGASTLLVEGALFGLAASGCAGTLGAQPPRTAESAQRNYPGPCSDVELDVLETTPPARGAGVSNLGENSLEVVATYRPGDKPERTTDVVSFRERREREDDPQAQLREQTFAVCGGEATGTPTGTQERPAAPNAEPSAESVAPDAAAGPAAGDQR